MEKQVNSNYINRKDNDDEAAAIQVLTACGSAALETVLKTAIQLDIFEIIAKGGDGAHLSTSDIVSQLPTHSTQEAASILDCMLSYLVAHSLLTCSASQLPNGKFERRYGLASAGKFYVGDESGVSLAPYHSLCCNGYMTELGFGLKDAILEGIGSGTTLFERVKGKPFYEYVKSSDPESHKRFNISMGAHSILVMKKVLKMYNGFEGLSSIVDVGGGNGVALDMIISKYPSIHGINFDLPEVIQTAPSYNGIEHIGGDMFLEIPKGNAILLKWILHNWIDDQCLKLLHNCYKSLPNKGKAIVLDYILPEIPRSDDYSKLATQADFIMQTAFGGKERTMREFEAMAIKAGFEQFKVVCCGFGLWIMELIK